MTRYLTIIGMVLMGTATAASASVTPSSGGPGQQQKNIIKCGKPVCNRPETSASSSATCPTKAPGLAAQIFKTPGAKPAP